MPASRQRDETQASRTVRADLIAPEGHGRVVRFRPVFADMHIVDAEFEDISGATSAAADPVAAHDDRQPGRRFESLVGRPGSFAGTESAATRTGSMKAHLFPLAVAALCVLSFLIFGGRVAFSGMDGNHPAVALVASPPPDTGAPDDFVTGSTPTTAASRPATLPGAASGDVIIVDRSGGSN